jgi:hypothetical protein
VGLVQSGGVEAADLPGERGAGALEREELHLLFTGHERWFVDRRVESDRIGHVWAP